MASYPNSVKTFTTKNAGDTIQPSHINDLQDEVNALEDGLLNGTAPITSSRITAPASQITNSTVTTLTATNLKSGGGTYALPSSGGSTGDVLTCVSTSGSTMTLQWRPVAASGPTVKAWGKVTFSGGTPTLAANYGIDSIVDQSTGTVWFKFTTPLGSSHYATLVTLNVGVDLPTVYATGATSTGVQVVVGRSNDPADYNFTMTVLST